MRRARRAAPEQLPAAERNQAAIQAWRRRNPQVQTHVTHPSDQPMWVPLRVDDMFSDAPTVEELDPMEMYHEAPSFGVAFFKKR